MEFNDLGALLMQIPSALAAKWAVWFAFGLGLSIWGRREKMYTPAYEAPPKPKSDVRPTRPAWVAPASSGDAFGELEALLEPQEGTHRMPGEAPASPVLTEAPRLAAPQSLP